MWARRLVGWHHERLLASIKAGVESVSCSVKRGGTRTPQSGARAYASGGASSSGGSSSSGGAVVGRSASSSTGAGPAAETLLPGVEAGAQNRWKFLQFAVPATLAMGIAGYVATAPPDKAATAGGEGAVLVNWSGTHECTTQRLLQPTTTEELERMVAEAHQNGTKLRCMGSGLSPNGISFEEGGMVSLALMDKILAVDKDKGQVTVQAGARVQEVADQLRGHGLTLQNYASIREQTIGGFTQVSAHGTGAAIPPVDETVVAMKLVTPAHGTLELSKERDPHLFNLAKVGLGCLGVVAEITLQCVPAHKLLEHTFTTNRKGVRRNHAKWLHQHQHIRYMWVPYTDTVVVVTNNPVPEGTEPPRTTERSHEELMEPYWALAKETGKFEKEELLVMTPTELRDALLHLAPLDAAWVKRVNQADAAHWSMREGYRIGWSDQLLGFDCGGQQWVLETAFPAGTLKRPNNRDLDYMDDLMKLISTNHVAAHPPIEQRWTAASCAAMSPAHAPNPDALISWVGIIMYLPEDEEARAKVTQGFRDYTGMTLKRLVPKYGASEHWAKLELPADPEERRQQVQRVQTRYPMREFCEARARLDPKNILGNALMDELFPILQAAAHGQAHQ